jgi:hypothetical protein
VEIRSSRTASGIESSPQIFDLRARLSHRRGTPSTVDLRSEGHCCIPTQRGLDLISAAGVRSGGLESRIPLRPDLYAGKPLSFR